MAPLNLRNIDTNPYFDLTSKNLDEISIFETNNKYSCFISPKKMGHIYYGFKLTNKPLVNIVCDVKFFRSKATEKYIPRLTLKKVDKNGTKEQKPKEKVIIDLNESETAENFWKMIGFLGGFKDLVDLGDFEKSYKVVDANAYMVEFNTKETVDKIEAIKGFISKTDLSEDDIKKLLEDEREGNLQEFSLLLSEPNFHNIYRGIPKNSDVNGIGEEAVWQHFLKKHHWILGINCDLRFIRDLIKEANIGETNTSGKGSPTADYLGISDYTTLIELKTPSTKIFKSNKSNTARANTWPFTSDFIDGISQCLAQKYSFDKSEPEIINEDGEIQDTRETRTLDPKTIFIIGDKSTEFPETNKTVENITKRDTFERFRRNNRNIEIITFDELYERAYYIVHGKRPNP